MMTYKFLPNGAIDLSPTEIETVYPRAVVSTMPQLPSPTPVPMPMPTSEVKSQTPKGCGCGCGGHKDEDEEVENNGDSVLSIYGFGMCIGMFKIAIFIAFLAILVQIAKKILS
jgi:hypothetical protein